MKAVLLITDAAHGAAHGLLDLVAHAGCPAFGVRVRVIIEHALATDFAGQQDALSRHHRFASDARLRIAGEHEINNGIADLVRDLVGMAFGNRFGGEQKR